MAKTGWASMLLIVLVLAACHSRGNRADDAQPAHEAPSVAPSIPPTVVDPEVTARLRSFAGRDTDHDGYISIAENAAAADNVFDAIDRDQDGSITAQELDAARSALGLAPVPSSAQQIAEADQDHDGKLTLAEWIAHEGRMFKAADQNGDGKLSQAEWLMLPKLEDPRPAPSASAGATADSDPDD